LVADNIFLRIATTISLEQNLNTSQYQLIMLGDFITPNYDWIKGTPLSKSYNWNKIKRN
jgi:hypothetical protein